MRYVEQDRRVGAVVLLISLVLSMRETQAQPASVLPWMTGERLVKLMGNVDQRTVHWSPESPFPNRAIAAEYLDMANGEFVRGYIQAVHDAGEGHDWCWSGNQPKPHNLIEEARRHLQQSPSALLQRNAATLIAEHWREQFPCPTGAKRRPK